MYVSPALPRNNPCYSIPCSVPRQPSPPFSSFWHTIFHIRPIPASPLTTEVQICWVLWIHCKCIRLFNFVWFVCLLVWLTTWLCRFCTLHAHGPGSWRTWLRKRFPSVYQRSKSSRKIRRTTPSTDMRRARTQRLPSLCLLTLEHSNKATNWFAGRLFRYDLG